MSGPGAGGVGVVAALAAEARLLGTPIPHAPGLARLDDGTLVAVGGVGPEAASRAARRLLDAGVGALVSWGLAGGLDPALRAGTLFLAEQVRGPDGPQLPASGYWLDRLQAALAGHCTIARGVLLTSARPIATVADKAAAFGATGAGVVDMESLPVAQLAAGHGLPFIAVRVIIDSAHDAVPASMLAALGDSGQLRIGRLLGALAGAPGDVLALLRLGRRYRLATRALGAVARRGAMAANAFPVVADAGASRGIPRGTA